MRESVLTKNLNDSVIKPPGNHLLMLTTYHEKNMDMEMLERLQAMTSPVDERRRLVQERVITKHRLETEKQFWIEKDNYVNSNAKVLRKTSSLNDLTKFNQQHNPRMRRIPRSYLQIHQDRMDDIRSDGSSNASSRTASSQDNYPQFYIGDQRINRGEIPGSRLSLAQMEYIQALDPMVNRSENFSKESYMGVQRDGQLSWRNESPGYFSNPSRLLNNPVTINTSRSEHPSMNKNFTRAHVNEPEVMSARFDVNEYRPERTPVPNISSYRDGKIFVTMTANEKNAKCPKSARQERKGSNTGVSTAKLDKVITNMQKSEKPVHVPTPPKEKQPNGLTQTRNEKVVGANNVNSTTIRRREKSEKPVTNVLYVESRVPNTSLQSKSSKPMSRNLSKNSNEKSTSPPSNSTKAKNTSPRKNPEWYERFQNQNVDNAEKCDKENENSSSKNRKYFGKSENINDKPKSKNASPSKPQQETLTYDASKKPRQSSLKKSSSFKVGASSNFFGYMSMEGARMSPKKKVTFSNDESSRPGTA